MGMFLGDIPVWALAVSLAVTLVAGFVKGAVGFAMPMIMIAGLSTILPGEIALGILILPTVATNLFQAFRQGWRAALETVKRFRVYLGILLVLLAFSAQLVRLLPADGFYLILGIPVALFSLSQLLGLRLRLNPHTRLRDELIIGGCAGLTGGISGVWGPPTVLYLTAIGTEKREQMRAQGVIYGLGAVALLLAHMRSGVFNAQTAPISAAMLAPALLGMWLGARAHDALPQESFRRLTLIVLVVAGLNLIRRGLMG